MTATESGIKPLTEVIRPTTIIDSVRLKNKLGLGLELIIASETFQVTGSFKFRAAYNLASSIAQTKLLTASSGNYGQALAYACKLLGKQCIVVMPDNSAAVKVEAVKEFGGIVELVATREKSRKQRVAELSEIHPDAFVASAYDHPLIIQGNATLGHELSKAPIDVVVSPVGGGGLISGIITGLREKNSNAIVFGAEPAMANDAAKSLREGKIVAWDQEQQTIADGARTLSLGQHNWEVIKTGVKGIIEVPEEKIAEALKLLLWLANLKVEPTGALALGAVLTAPEQFHNKRVCCVVSGGNVDPEIFIRLLNM